MTQQYALVAINDEEQVCQFCGKVDLKKVMWLVNVDADGNKHGEAFAVGTTCGAKMLGQTTSKINTAIKGFNHKVWQQKQIARRNHPLAGKAREMEDSFLSMLNEQRQKGNYELSFSDNPNREEIFRLKEIINNDVDAMEFLVAI